MTEGLRATHHPTTLAIIGGDSGYEPVVKIGDAGRPLKFRTRHNDPMTCPTWSLTIDAITR